MENVVFEWNEVDSQADQPLPAEVRCLQISTRRDHALQDPKSCHPDGTVVIELSTPESELLNGLPLPAILAAAADTRLAEVAVVLPVSGTTLLESLINTMNAAVTVQPRPRSSFDDGGVWPSLVPQSRAGISGWRKRLIEQILDNRPATPRVQRLALEAGLLQLQDDLEGSHQCAQAIEGEGRHRPGDYWHAIMHRREPDASNSKYWFRHVGEHPIFADLLADVAHFAVSSSSAEFRRWSTEQAGKSTWDPYAFVDLCSRAERLGDSELRQSCEQFQYREMLRLLVWTWQFAMGGRGTNSGFA